MSETKGNGSGLNMLKRPSDDDKARAILMPDETAAPVEVEASAPGIDELLKKIKVPQYATVPLNTRIPDWLDTDLDRMLKEAWPGEAGSRDQCLGRVHRGKATA